MPKERHAPLHVFDDIDDDYFMWLCSLVDAEDPDQGYLGIMKLMYRMDFDDRSARLVPNDGNRIEDGLELKKYYINEIINPEYRSDISLDFIERCSLLEMMIALAYRIEHTHYCYDGTYWFWEMMRNLGLENCTDVYFYDRGWAERARKILKNLLERKYDYDGYGGLFPLNNPQKDQRKCEIWHQASCYFGENYL